MLISLFFFTAMTAMADKVKVRIFSTNTITSVTVSFDLGQYNVYANASVLLESTLGEGASLTLKPSGGKVSIASDGYNYGIFEKIRFQATDTACILCINPSNVKQRTY